MSTNPVNQELDEKWKFIDSVMDKITEFYDKKGPGPTIKEMTECLKINGGHHLMRRSILSHMIVRKIDPYSLGLNESKMRWAMSEVTNHMVDLKAELESQILH